MILRVCFLSWPMICLRWFLQPLTLCAYVRRQVIKLYTARYFYLVVLTRRRSDNGSTPVLVEGDDDFVEGDAETVVRPTPLNNAPKAIKRSSIGSRVEILLSSGISALRISLLL